MMKKLSIILTTVIILSIICIPYSFSEDLSLLNSKWTDHIPIDNYSINLIASDNSNIYLYTNSTAFYSLNSNSGQINWHYDYYNNYLYNSIYFPALGSLSISDNTIYLLTNLVTVSAFNKKGYMKWQEEVPIDSEIPLFATIASNANRIYILLVTSNYPNKYYNPYNKRYSLEFKFKAIMFSLDKNGNLIWKKTFVPNDQDYGTYNYDTYDFTTILPNIPAIAIDKMGHVYADVFNRFYAVDEKGTILWQYPTVNSNVSFISINHNTIYLANINCTYTTITTYSTNGNRLLEKSIKCDNKTYYTNLIKNYIQLIFAYNFNTNISDIKSDGNYYIYYVNTSNKDYSLPFDESKVINGLELIKSQKIYIDPNTHIVYIPTKYNLCCFDPNKGFKNLKILDSMLFSNISKYVIDITSNKIFIINKQDILRSFNSPNIKTGILKNNNFTYIRNKDNFLCSSQINSNFILLGTIKWTFNIKGGISSSPAISPKGIVYVGSGSGNLYALYPSGILKWKFKTGDKIESSPAIGPEGTIYFGSDDGNLYALYPSGILKWKFKTGDKIESSPAIGPEGTIYFGSDDGNLYALYPSGILKWKFTFPYYSAPLVPTKTNSLSPLIDSDDNIYIVTRSSMSDEYSNEYGWDNNYCYQYTYNGHPGCLGGQFLYYLYKLNSKGKLLWRYESLTPIRSVLICQNNDVCLSTSSSIRDFYPSDAPTRFRVFLSGKTYILNQQGRCIISFPYNDPNAWISFTIDNNNNILYMPCESILYALNAGGLKLNNLIWPKFRHDKENTGSSKILDIPPVIKSFSIVNQITGTPNYMSAHVPFTVIFNCNAYDPDGYITKYEWDFNGDGKIDHISTNGTVSYTYDVSGNYTPTVTVVDNKGAESKANDITIHAMKPKKHWYNITNNLYIKESRPLFDRRHRCFFIYVTIRNSGPSIPGPIRLDLINPNIPVDTSCPIGAKVTGKNLDSNTYYFDLIPENGLLPKKGQITIRINFKLERKRLSYQIKIKRYGRYYQ